MTAVPLAPVRRWISRRQSAHRERGATAGNIYFTVLFLAVVGGMVHKQLAVVFWPTHPNASALAAASLVPILFGLLYLALRRFGPLALSRPAASWLLPAPVSRRRLLLPSLRLTAIVAAIVGALAGLAVLGHGAPRTLGGEQIALFGTGAALIGVALLLVALAAQAGGRWGDRLDAVVSLLLAAGLVGLVTDATGDHAPAADGWPPARTLVPLVGALALVVALLFTLAVRGLARTPNQRILEAAKTAGTLFDSAFGMEPTFLTDMIERRYWAHRKLRSMHLSARLPVLVGQDLLLVLRRRSRLLWLVLAAALPVLLADAPHWLIGLAILVGAMLAGSTAAGNVKTDAGNPVLLRILGLSSRTAVRQRMWVPGILAGVWSALALGLLSALGDLPSGPWWVLGLVLGPVGAVASVRRARVGFVRNELLPLDTPMGTVSTGPLVNAAIGPDALLLGLPALIEIAQGHPLSWLTVLVQAVVGGLGARAYLAGTTAADRVELHALR
ncbi:hypothetical protein GCM10010172_21370 [Paractinoplanes ferrugineus]|uniref:Uncharacterized protein n=1 Tax=Paractinoplanes ferrugineus TaxID=113564 RepID=A0A919IVT7_9ACTN|nr:DUF6297 family protein [Actinoplanes ferrugineus]GIE08952.1 hypothetical protein Afe05nite_07920 [Actinoplanes ferrugineus]